MTKPTRCNACGRVISCTDKNGVTTNLWAVMGVKTVGQGMSAELRKFTKEAMRPYKVNKEYYICWPCALKTFGVKP